MNESYRFVHGNTDDFFSILYEAIDWCDKTNKNMWKRSEISEKELLSLLNTDCFIVLKMNNENVAGMILQYEDTLFWPKSKIKEAGYIHKLCVSRKHAGNDISRKMIEYAIEQCMKEDIKFLRLDTGEDRSQLRKIYESNGFILKNYIEVNDTNYCLYEMNLSKKI